MGFGSSVDLAELIGILFGDGFINYYSDGHHLIEISGNSINDKEYHFGYISSLFRNIFGVKLKHRFRKDQNTLVSYICSKKIYELLLTAGMVKGRKQNMRISHWIRSDEKYVIAFIKGLFDTDGSLIIRKKGQHSISWGLKDKALIGCVRYEFEKLGYYVSVYSEE